MLERSQKEKPTLDLLHRMDLSYQKETFFQKFVSLYIKSNDWNKLIQQRAQNFWLENDYVAY